MFYYVIRWLFHVPYFRSQMELNFRTPQASIFGSVVRFLMNKKNRWASEEAVDLLDIKPGEVYLEVGFGSGWALRKVLETEPSRIIGYELSQSMFDEVSQNKNLQDERIQLVLGDCSEMSAVRDLVVDSLLIVNVVYFLQPLEVYTKEFYRVLATDGKLIAVLKLDTVSKFDPEIFVNTEEGAIENGFQSAGFNTKFQEMDEKGYVALICTKPAEQD